MYSQPSVGRRNTKKPALRWFVMNATSSVPIERARRERREQPEHERRARRELGDAREPRVQDPRLHAEAREPPGGALDLAAPVDVVVAVRDHRGARRRRAGRADRGCTWSMQPWARTVVRSTHGRLRISTTTTTTRSRSSTAAPAWGSSRTRTRCSRWCVREHPMKREGDDDAVIVPEGADIDFMPIDRSVGVFTAYSFDAVQQVLKDGETFSSAGYADVMGQVLGHSILEMDEPEHHLYRGLVQQAFSRKAMETWERELVRDVVDEHIDAFIDRPTKRADLVRELTFPFPVVVIARLLGLPREDLPDVPPPRGRGDQRRLRDRPRGRTRRNALFDYFCAIIAERRVHPSDDVISVLVQAELDGERLDRRRDLLVPAPPAAGRRGDHVPLVEQPPLRPADEPRTARRAACRPRAHAAGDRRGPALGTAAARHHAHRDARHRGRRRVRSRGLGRRASTSAPRTTTRRYWDNPEEFDIFRPPRQHLAFAWGPHMCLGLHLARMETRVVLTQLLDRLPGPAPRPRRRAAAHHRRDLPRAARAPRHLGLTDAAQRSRNRARTVQLRSAHGLHARRMLRRARRGRRRAPRVRRDDRRVPRVLDGTGERPQPRRCRSTGSRGLPPATGGASARPGGRRRTRPGAAPRVNLAATHAGRHRMVFPGGPAPSATPDPTAYTDADVRNRFRGGTACSSKTSSSSVSTTTSSSRPTCSRATCPQKYADVAPKLVRKDSGIDVWQFMGAGAARTSGSTRSPAVRPRSTRWTRSRSTTCAPVATTSTTASRT